MILRQLGSMIHPGSAGTCSPTTQTSFVWEGDVRVVKNHDRRPRIIYATFGWVYDFGSQGSASSTVERAGCSSTDLHAAQELDAVVQRPQDSAIMIDWVVSEGGVAEQSK